MSIGRKATTAAIGACHSGLISRSRRRRRLARHLRSLGHCLETPDEIERVCRERDLPLDELDVHLNGFGWEDSWDNFTGPQAKAHHLLKGLDLGGGGSALRQAGQIIFDEFGDLRAIRPHMG